MEENRTPIPSLARSDSTTELPPQIREASSGNRTRIDGLEDRGPTLGRCPHEPVPDDSCPYLLSFSQRSCPRELHSSSPAYQAGAPLSGPQQQKWSRLESNQPLPDANRMLSRVSHDPSISTRQTNSGAPGNRTPISAMREQCSPIELSSHSDGQRMSWELPEAGVSPPPTRGFEPHDFDAIDVFTR